MKTKSTLEVLAIVLLAIAFQACTIHNSCAQSKDPIVISALAVMYIDDDYDAQLDGPDTYTQAVDLILWPGTKKQYRKNQATQCTIVKGKGKNEEARMTYLVKLDTTNRKNGYDVVLVRDWAAKVKPNAIQIEHDSLIICKGEYVKTLQLEVLPKSQPVPPPQKGLVFAAKDSIAYNIAPDRKLLVRLKFSDLLWRTDEHSVLRSRPYGDFKTIGISSEALDVTYGGWKLWGSTKNGTFLTFSYHVGTDGSLLLDSTHLGAFKQEGKRDSPVFVTYKYVDPRTGIERDSTEEFEEFVVTIKPPIEPKVIELKSDMISVIDSNTFMVSFPVDMVPYMETRKAKPEISLLDNQGHIGDWYMLNRTGLQGNELYTIILHKNQGFYLENGKVAYITSGLVPKPGFPGLQEEHEVPERFAQEFVVRPRMVD